MLHNFFGFFSKYFTIPNIYFSDVIEIIIIAIAVYYIIIWFRRSRAWVLIKGLVVLLIFTVIASLFQLTTLTWIMNRVFSVGIIAMVIIFQPELRRALEALGKRNVLFKVFKIGNTIYEERFSDKTLEAISSAVKELSSTKTGALIVVEKEFSLDQYIETGIRLEAKVTSQLLLNIFEKNTPLHDGAVIISENEIVAATCYLPMDGGMNLSKDLGTRHRAAVSLTEVSDCLVIVVSEETGDVAIAQEGNLDRDVKPEDVTSALIEAQDKEVAKSKKIFKKGSDVDERK